MDPMVLFHLARRREAQPEADSTRADLPAIIPLMIQRIKSWRRSAAMGLWLVEIWSHSTGRFRLS
jgi:hypothetical protein